MLNQKNAMRLFVFTIVLTTSILCAKDVQAGTASYTAKCSFIDRETQNGGNISKMPCYAVEGGNMYSIFFHILWKDGVKTQLNMRSDSPLKDFTTNKVYKRVSRYKFVAVSDGDIIFLEDVKYTELRYSVDDPMAAKLLK